jgi:menaquinone-dependent protoporphyrinogen oxidase
MADIVIVYGTTEGQTRKIARHAADHLTREKHHVLLVDAADAPADLAAKIAAADGVVLASSVHMGRHNAAVARVIDRCRDALAGKPSAFISVSLSILSDDPAEHAEAEGYAAGFFDRAGWTPQAVHHAAGALRYAEYDWMRGWIIRRLAKERGMPVDKSHDYEFTDWKALEKFADDFAASLAR